MRLHVDTTFLIDWYRRIPQAVALANQILDRQHQASVDPIVETEYFAIQRADERRYALFDGLLAVADRLPISSEASGLAASWLAPMDERKRRAHFADALIGAVATLDGAILVTADQRIPRLFPVQVIGYGAGSL